jgi:hypothetical protein
MDTTQLVTLISSLCTIIALVGTIIGKLMSGHTTKLVNSVVKDYLSELKPNHGSSLRDDIVCIKKDLTDLKVDVATLEGKFDQHIKENAL